MHAEHLVHLLEDIVESNQTGCKIAVDPTDMLARDNKPQIASIVDRRISPYLP